MICAICQTDNSEDSRFCTKCGGGLGTAVLPAPIDRRAADAKLAAANLARSKSNWDEADRLCMEVLKAEPNNVDAYALLGDIHRDRGRLEDAAQWYNMALDLKGDWPTVKARLGDVEKKLARRGSRAASAKPSSGGGTQKLLGAAPQTWLQVTLGAAVVFLVGTVLVLISLRNRPVERLLPRSSRPLSPAAAPAGGSPVPLANSAVLGGSPSGPAPSARPMPRPPAQRGFDPPNTPAAEPEAGTAMPPVSGLSAQEMALRDLLGRGVGAAQVASVTVDPRLPGATVVLVRPAPGPGVSLQVVRQTLMEEAALAARSIFTAPDGYRAATISIRVVGPGGRLEPVFSGDTDRGLFASAIGGANPDVTRVFRNVWWSAGAPNSGQPVEQPPTGGGVEAFDRP
jgi:hypothetical protein